MSRTNKNIFQFVGYISYNTIVTQIPSSLKKFATVIHYKIKTMKNFIGTNIMSRLIVF